jgi:hypothetical protein
MFGVLLSTNPVILLNLLDPGAFLFGLVFMAMSASLPILFLLRRQPTLAKALLILLVCIEAALLVVLALDFSSIPSVSSVDEFRSISVMLANHRWLLFELPLLLLTLAIITLAVYGRRIVEPHARHYRQTVLVSVLVSFTSVILIALEAFV